jgi:Ca-activated chloride channel family protein
MNFQYPDLIYAVPLLLLLGIVYRWRARTALEKSRFPYFLISVCFVVIALANPYWRSVPAKEKIKGVDLLIVTDVSQSMFCKVNDRTTRMDLARKFIKRLLPSFAGSQIAVIYFAGDAQIGTPFTTDLPAISLFMDSITPPMSAQAGTRTESLQEALQQVLKSKTSRKVPLILFFSDGEFFDSGKTFQNYVKRQDLRVFTYLCGEQKAPVLRYDLAVAVPGAFSTPNPASLQSLAHAGKGAFFNLTKERTDQIFQELNRKVEDLIVEGQSVPDYRPVPFLIVALLFLLLYQWIPISQEKLRPAATVIALFLVFSVSMKFEDSLKLYQEALQAIRNGKQDLALQKLKSLPADFPANEKEIAVGNAYFYAGKYQEAIQNYQKVLDRDPFHALARWNWEVALKQQTDQKQRPPQPRQQPSPQNMPENRDALLQYVDQLEKEQRQKSNRSNIGKSDFAW